MRATTRDYIQAHRGDGAEAIAAALAADYATVQEVPVDLLQAYVTRTGLFTPFLAYKAGLLSEELAALKPVFATVDYLLNTLPTTVATTDPAIAAQMQQILGTLGGAGIISDADIAGFLALGGGYRYERLTVDEVAAELARLDAVDAAAALLAEARSTSTALLAVDEAVLLPLQQAYSARRDRHAAIIAPLSALVEQGKAGLEVTVPERSAIQAQLEVP